MFDRLVWFRGGDWALRGPTPSSRRRRSRISTAMAGRISLPAINPSSTATATRSISTCRIRTRTDSSRPHGPAEEGLRWPISTPLAAGYRGERAVASQPVRRAAEWDPRRSIAAWTRAHAFIDVHDINGDGRLDIVLSPSERVGRATGSRCSRHRSIRRASGKSTSSTRMSRLFVSSSAPAVIDSRLSQVDIVCAHVFSAGPHEVKIYFNLRRSRVTPVLLDDQLPRIRPPESTPIGAIACTIERRSPRQAIELWVNRPVRRHSRAPADAGSHPDAPCLSEPLFVAAATSTVTAPDVASAAGGTAIQAAPPADGSAGRSVRPRTISRCSPISTAMATSISWQHASAAPTRMRHSHGPRTTAAELPRPHQHP